MLAAAGVNLWSLSGELAPAAAFNDGVVHQSMIEWAAGRLREGRLPLDGWFPYFNMGASEFHRYQSLPHLLMAFPALLVGASAVYHWSLYLLLALWPLSVYWGGRLLGLHGWAAAIAAALSPIVASVTCYGFEDCTYVWWGLGAWTQLWGMWLLPLVWGVSWRAVAGRGSVAAGAALLALLIACHFLTGYLAILSLGVWVVIGGREILGRALRAAAVGLGAAGIAAWVVVPVLQDSAWLPQSEFNLNTFWLDSYGAPKVLGWLFQGDLLDHGHFALLSLLLALGLLAALATSWRSEPARALIGVFLLSLLLFFGRPTIGPVLSILPFGSHLFLHRYLFGVQLAGLYLGGAGVYLSMLGLFRLHEKVGWPVARRPFVRPAAAVAAGLLLLGASLPGWHDKLDVAAYHDQLRDTQLYYQDTDGAGLEDLLAIVKSRGDGRAYAGMAGAPSGMSYAVGYMPALTFLERDQLDSVGFTLRVNSLMIDPEARFNPGSPAEYDLYNVKYVLLPTGQRPGVPARQIAQSGRHVLWQVDTTGYFEVVDTVWPPIVEHPEDIGRASQSFLYSQDLVARRFPSVAYNGAIPPGPTLGGEAAGPAGAIIGQAARPADGVFTAHVVANREAMLLLKESYDPRWHFSVDGVDVRPQLVAPALVGVPVSAGEHEVTARYEPFGQYPALLAVGALVLLALALVPVGWRRWDGSAALRRRVISTRLALKRPLSSTDRAHGFGP